MTKTLYTLFVAGLLGGCAPTNLMQPTFPAVAPEKPAKTDSDNPRSAMKGEARNPVSAKEVNENNARKSLRDLNAELEQDSADKSEKN
jgi:hypothetical protein